LSFTAAKLRQTRNGSPEFCQRNGGLASLDFSKSCWCSVWLWNDVSCDRLPTVGRLSSRAGLSPGPDHWRGPSASLAMNSCATCRLNWMLCLRCFAMGFHSAKTQQTSSIPQSDLSTLRGALHQTPRPFTGEWHDCGLALTGSISGPRSTSLSASPGKGRCSAMASTHAARSQASRSSWSSGSPASP
jgi:hypothetical protein